MRSPIPDYLAEVLDTCNADGGELADYIPELAHADPDRLALALTTTDGAVYGVGDADQEFTIQSISKPFVYALALAEHGFETVLDEVGVEPSGEAFNELSLEEESGRPLNPIINAGALTTHALVAPEAIAAGFAAFAGRELDVDESVLASELETADRNRAIAYMLRNHAIVDADPLEVVEGYTRQCSVLVTARDLASMAATLANGGVQPQTGEQVVDRRVVRQVLSVMTSCGMYDAAGDWLSVVGIPAKSGVSGGVIGALPGQVGLAAFSPRLDRHGNSVRGVRIFERLSDDMGMHLMEAPPPARSLVRGRGRRPGHDEQRSWVYELQGSLDFVGMEQLLRELTERTPGEQAVVFDLSRVVETRDVGRRMLLEAARRLSLDGHELTLVDPAGVLGAFDGSAERDSVDTGGGVRAEVVRTR